MKGTNLGTAMKIRLLLRCCAFVCTALGYLVLTACTKEADPVQLPTLSIDGVELPVAVCTRHAERIALTPEQLNPYDRPLARHLKRGGQDTAVLFVYPDDLFRSVHLDRDPSGGTLGLVYLTKDGRVDSTVAVKGAEQLILSEGAIRYVLFLPEPWFSQHPITKKSVIQLPASATASAAAEPEFTPITDPPPVKVKVGGVPIKVEVACRTATRNRGLMYRNYIPDNTGMLFLFPQPREQKFWMRNTRASLDIAYIDADYRIANILTMQSHDLDQSSRYKSYGPVIIARETRANWFRAHQVKKGARLEVSEAVKQLQKSSDP